MTNDNIRDLRQILCHYGIRPQIDKLREELRELDEAAGEKCINGDLASAANHFIEELADVTIMIEQMKLAMTTGEQALYYTIINQKIERQLGRIANEQL